MIAFFDCLAKEGIYSSSSDPRCAPLFPRQLLYSTNKEAQILIDKFKYLSKHLSIIMKPIDLTDTPIPLFPSKSIEDF